MSKYTQGPWRWEVNLKMKQIRLCGGVPKYDLTVMDFIRYGMGGAQPRFLKVARQDHMLLEKADSFSEIVEGREHHEDWFRTLNHPDAKLIAAAPEMYELLGKMLAYKEHILSDTYKEIESLLNKIDQP